MFDYEFQVLLQIAGIIGFRYGKEIGGSQNLPVGTPDAARAMLAEGEIEVPEFLNGEWADDPNAIVLLARYGNTSQAYAAEMRAWLNGERDPDEESDLTEAVADGAVSGYQTAMECRLRDLANLHYVIVPADDWDNVWAAGDPVANRFATAYEAEQALTNLVATIGGSTRDWQVRAAT
jgi:hypothetical protein